MESECVDGISVARSVFAFLQIFRKHSVITRIADRHHGSGEEVLRNSENAIGVFRIKTRHLMTDKSEGGKLEHHVPRCAAEVVKSASVFLSVFRKGSPRKADPKNSRVLCPRISGSQQPFKSFAKRSIIFERIDVPPRLFVVTTGRPTRRLKKCCDLFGFHQAIAESEGGPSLENRIEDRIRDWCRFMRNSHGVSKGCVHHNGSRTSTLCSAFAEHPSIPAKKETQEHASHRPLASGTSASTHASRDAQYDICH